MKFKKVEVDCDGPVWISGIYKIVPYEWKDGHKIRWYAAYYIPKGWKNWGNHVDPKNPSYRSLKEAKAACEKHMKESEGG